MDRAAALELQRRSLASFARLLGSDDRSRVIDRNGVTAAVVPAIPDRSVANSVAYRDGEALGAALDDLTAAYDDAGVRAWTVWVPEDDRDAAALLEAAGHRLDAEPIAMIAALAGLPDPEPDELDWDGTADPHVLGRINDLAYGWPEGTFGKALGHFADVEGVRLSRPGGDGDPVCALGPQGGAGVSGISFGGPVPALRGKGLACSFLNPAWGGSGDPRMVTPSFVSWNWGFPVPGRPGSEPICK